MASILIIEDDEIIACHLAHVLTRFGYTPIGPVAAGEAGLAEVERARPDLVLMDIALHGQTDGLAAADTIRSRWGTPIVFLTACADDDTLRRARVTDPFGYLVKPFDERSLHATLEMALHKSRLEADLRRSEERYRRIVETTREGVWVIDPQHRTTYANRRMGELLGLSPGELVGSSIFDFIPPEQRAEVRAHLDGLRDSPWVEVEFCLVRPDGTRLWVQVSASCLFDETGGVSGLLGMFTDITARKESDARLQWELAVNRAMAVVSTELAAADVCVERAGRMILEQALALTGSQAGCIARLDPDTGRLVARDAAEPCLEPGGSPAEGTEPVFTAGPLSASLCACLDGGILEPPGPFFTNDPSGLPDWASPPAGHPPLRSLLSVPALFGGRPVGQIVLTGAPDGYSGRELQAVERLARLYALLLLREREAQALRAGEARFRAIFESAAIGILLIGPDGHAAAANPAVTAMLGYSLEELRARTDLDFTHPEDVQPSQDLTQQVFAGQLPGFVVEKRCLHKDGRTVWARLTVSPVVNADNGAEAGRPVFALFMLEDITERKAAEAARRNSEALFRAGFDGANIGIDLAASDGRLVAANPALARMLGYTQAELLTMSFLDFSHPDDAAWDWKLCSEVFAGHLPGFTLEKRLLRKDGRTVWVRLTVSPVLDEAGRPTFNMGMIEDITGSKLAEEARKASEARFRAVFENAGVGIVLTGPDERMAVVNPAMAEMLGCLRHELEGRSWAEFTHPHDVEKDRDLAEAFFAGRLPGYQLEKRYLRRDGAVIWARLTVSPFLDDGGRLRLSLAVIEDITARKAAEEALRESETRFRAVFENAGVGIVLADADGTIQDANPALARLLDYTPAELRGRSTFDLTLDEDRYTSEIIQRSILGDRFESVELEKRYLRRDGRPVWMRVTATPVIDADGQARFSIGMMADITARKAAEEALRESESRFRAVFEEAGIGIVLIGEDGQPFEANPAMLALLGYSREELFSRTILDLIHPQEHARVDSVQAMLLVPEHSAFRAEQRFLHRDGRTVWARVTATPVEDGAGMIRFVVGMLEDITAQKQAEVEALRLAAVVEQANESVVITDQDGMIVYTNPFFERVTGYQQGEVLGREVDFLRSAAEMTPLANLRPTLRAGKTWTGSLRTQRKDGVLFDEEAAIFPIKDAGGQILNYAAVKRDITERRREERRVEARAALSAALRPAAHRDEMLPVLLEQLGKLLAADAVALARLMPASLAPDCSQSEPAGPGDLLVEAACGPWAGLKGLHLPTTVVTASAVLLPPPGMASVASTAAVTTGKPTHVVTASAVLPTAAERTAEAVTTHGLNGLPHVAVCPLASQDEQVGAIWVGRQAEFSADERAVLAEIAEIAASALHRAALHEAQTEAYDQTIAGWARALELRDIETEGHSQRVSEMTLRLAAALGLPEAERVHLRRGALLHDIGKMGISDSILHKPGKLDEAEWEVMRRHPVYAHDLLAAIPFLRPALDIPYGHHERWDGSGYPRGLRGEAIPLAARLFAVVDVWDALSSDRPYRPAWDIARVREYLRAEAGVQFDPRITAAFLVLLEEA